MSCVLEWTTAVLCLVCWNELKLYFVLCVGMNYSCTMSCVLDWTKAVLCLVCRNKLQLYFVLQLYYFFGVEINYSCTLSCVLTELQLYYVLCVGLKYSTAELCFVCWLNYLLLHRYVLYVCYNYWLFAWKIYFSMTYWSSWLWIRIFKKIINTKISKLR